MKTAVLALVLGALAIPVSAAQARKVEVEAGPIWSQADAQNKCPQVAADNGGTWTGQWRTTVPGRMSVCEIKIRKTGHKHVEDVEAGPIWSQSDAQTKCPAVAAAVGGTWNGNWRTTVPGQMSVCEVRMGP